MCCGSLQISWSRSAPRDDIEVPLDAGRAQLCRELRLWRLRGGLCVCPCPPRAAAGLAAALRPPQAATAGVEPNTNLSPQLAQCNLYASGWFVVGCCFFFLN